MLAALAGPRWGFTWEEARQRGLDIVVAMDTSRSMLARDVAPNRLEKAKRAAFDLMRQAKDDRLGLVAFAGAAFLQCPLTVDDEAFRQNLEALDTTVISQGGTALSEAIHSALGAFATGNNNHKALVLFTDGEDHDADADTMAAAQEAAEAGLRIFTVGVGTAAGELLQVTDDHGNTSFIKDEDGNVVKSHLNEDLLRRIATVTGGFYLPLVGANPMEILYSQGLAPMPKSEATVKLTRVYRERYHWFLGFAVLCLVAEMLLPEGPRARRAETAARRLPAGWRTAAVILGMLLVPAPARASGTGAFNQYQSGDYQGAFEEYNRLAGEKTNDYRLHYNAGTSAYRAKELDAAEKQLGAALNTPEIVSDLQAQEHAYYNLGNTLYRLGEPAADPKKKQERWEQSIANYSRALRLEHQRPGRQEQPRLCQKEIGGTQAAATAAEETKEQEPEQDQKNQDTKGISRIRRTRTRKTSRTSNRNHPSRTSRTRKTSKTRRNSKRTSNRTHPTRPSPPATASGARNRDQTSKPSSRGPRK